LALPWALNAQDQYSAAIQKKLESEYQITKPSDDKSSIVTAGSVVLLHKDKIAMVPVTASTSPCGMNTYKNGKLSGGGCGVAKKLRSIPGFGSQIPFTDKMPATRNFVSDEKFWVTRIEVGSNRVVFSFFSDPISDVRYQGVLTIPFESSNPTPEDVVKLVSEVITPVPSEDDKGAAKDNKPATEPAPAPPAPVPAPAVTEATPPTLQPPPPPPADPVEVKEGQTPDEVEKAFGPPLKKATVGSKQIYTYKDVKITFVDGKVKDIQ
jgi:hypothetical protein